MARFKGFFASESGGSGWQQLRMDKFPRTAKPFCRSRERMSWIVVLTQPPIEIIGLANIEFPIRILQDVDREIHDQGFGSSGRIRTYDQSVNPDCVGTLSLSYAFNLSRRSRISRADFHFLISRSRAMAAERVACGSDHTSDHGPFLRVNLPASFSLRL